MARRILKALVIVAFPAIYLSLVWSICSAQADGVQVDWGFTRGFLVVAGLVCFGVTVMLTWFFNLPDSQPMVAPVKVKQDETVVTHEHHVSVDMLPAYPREPLLQPDEQRLLIKVAAVTVVAGLVVVQLFKRWNKKG